MHIVMLVDALYEDVVGGSRVVARELARGLVSRGVRVTFVAPEPLSGRSAGAEGEGDYAVRRFAHRNPVDFFRQAARVTREIVSEQRVDLVHVHFAYPAVGLHVRPISHVPIVRSFYGSWADESRVESAGRRRSPVGRVALGASLRAKLAADALSLRRSSRVIVLSRFSYDEVVKEYGVAPQRVTLVPGGVDLQRFQPGDRAAARRRLGLPQGRPILLTVRRLVPRMGLERLLEAMPAVRDAHPGALLLIGGKGPIGEALKAQSERLGVGENVRLVGFIPDDDLASYYQAADLFVLPTVALEGFGLPTLEAMACGTPVLGTPVGATPELLTEVDPSLILVGTSATAIAEGLTAYLGSSPPPALAPERLRAFASRFSWERIVERTLRVYEEAIGAGATARDMTELCSEEAAS
jgi:glycosyltransferase involved in cell wall biosynthesis